MEPTSFICVRPPCGGLDEASLSDAHGLEPDVQVRSVFISLISVRRTVTIATLLVVCSLAPWSHSATADEINATTTAKPVGFAEIVLSRP